jgi:hypothetical protein
LPAGDTAISLSGRASVRSGEQIAYTARIVNKGPERVTWVQGDVVLSFSNFNVAVALVSVTATAGVLCWAGEPWDDGYYHDDLPVSCWVQRLDPDEKVDLTLVVVPRSPRAASITGTADLAGGECHDSRPDNNHAELKTRITPR